MLISQALASVSAVAGPIVVKPIPGLIAIGAALVIVGILTIVFRRSVRDHFARAQARTFGQSAGRAMDSTPPWAFAIAGGGAIGIGIVCFVLLFSVFLK
jgi:uncharacterized membrane protein HdeD (DUF308 family)